MDSKQIVNCIWDQPIIIGNEQKLVLIIEFKSSVITLKYELFSNHGEYLSGSHTRHLDFGQISNHPNHLIFHIEKSDVERLYFIRLSDVEVINPHQMSIQSESLIKIIDPIFHFYVLKLPPLPFEYQFQSHVHLSVDDENQPSPSPESQLAEGEVSSLEPQRGAIENLCHICQLHFGEHDAIKELPCHHRFHAQEIDEWLLKKNSCPICQLL